MLEYSYSTYMTHSMELLEKKRYKLSDNDVIFGICHFVLTRFECNEVFFYTLMQSSEAGNSMPSTTSNQKVILDVIMMKNVCFIDSVDYEALL